MKPLKKQFIGTGEVRNFKFNQLKATSKAFLYQVEADGRIHYEVFKRRENARFGYVSYPTSKGFGVWAWTYRDYNKANIRFNELNIGD